MKDLITIDMLLEWILCNNLDKIFITNEAYYGIYRKFIRETIIFDVERHFFWNPKSPHYLFMDDYKNRVYIEKSEEIKRLNQYFKWHLDNKTYSGWSLLRVFDGIEE
jgi:hypothetical protein